MKTILRKLKENKVALCVFGILSTSIFVALTLGRNSHEIAITPYRSTTVFVEVENVQTISETSDGDFVITTTDGETINISK